VDPGSGLSDTEVTTLTGTVGRTVQHRSSSPARHFRALLFQRAGEREQHDLLSVRLFRSASYNITVSNLSSTLYTILPPGTVNPVDGQFAGNQHAFAIDQGNINGGDQRPDRQQHHHRILFPGESAASGSWKRHRHGDSDLPGRFRKFPDLQHGGHSSGDHRRHLSRGLHQREPHRQRHAETCRHRAGSPDYANGRRHRLDRGGEPGLEETPSTGATGFPQENAPQGSAFVNTATREFSFDHLGRHVSGGLWIIIVGGGTNGRLDQSAGTVATGNGNWFFLGWQGAQGTYNQTGSGSLRVGGVTNPNGKHAHRPGQRNRLHLERQHHRHGPWPAASSRVATERRRGSST
jgi:hypothetical protein